MLIVTVERRRKTQNRRNGTWGSGWERERREKEKNCAVNLEWKQMIQIFLMIIR